MNKAHTDVRTRVMMQQQIQRIVADKGTCSVGHRTGKSRVLNGLCHLCHGNCGENTVGATGHDDFLHRLVSRIVRQTGSAHIDGNPFRRHRTASSCLSHAQDHIGADFRRLFQHDFRRQTHHRRNFHCVYFIFANHFRQPLHRFPGRIDGSPAKRIKTGNQQFFHLAHLRFSKIITYYTKLCKITHSVFEKLLYNELIT